MTPTEPAAASASATVRTAPNRGCSVLGCDRRHYAKDLCNMHYGRLQYRYESNADNVGKRAAGRACASALCSRCNKQVDALTADSGAGDRVRYFRSLTRAQLAAYVAGYCDARAGDDRSMPMAADAAAGRIR